ncbi:flavoprotein [Paludisphaera mucosa]|uniref:Flavoprotein n=1 Tax=Paludisphaera mucosa TaxID=3030827 RepID=A0ABT6F8J5_9BACT|nr:flavoprotein [Paludisphaera mucosa]MDG3003754.1 flavoprotein [Paludisphaera mucosa]
MARILVGTTGSVAAVRIPALCATLVAQGHEVRVVATEPALYFFDPAELPAGPPATTLHRDADEWPRGRYARGDDVLHIELRRWADLLVVAPLDANSLAKFALGLCDNLLSCLFRAWDFEKPVVLAPAMNTLMWRKPATARHLAQLWSDQVGRDVPPEWSLETAEGLFAHHAPAIILVPPQSKRLACGDVGLGAMAEVAHIAEAVRAWSERSTPPE